ncbi:hypothetical protein ACVJMY_008704 [Bradyrhizobium diazoefficiens]
MTRSRITIPVRYGAHNGLLVRYRAMSDKGPKAGSMGQHYER